MSKVLRSVVTGVGGYLPDEVVTNEALAKVVDTSDEWITERTGVNEFFRQAAGAAAAARSKDSVPPGADDRR